MSVDCGECPRTDGCPDGRCFRAQERRERADFFALEPSRPAPVDRDTDAYRLEEHRRFFNLGYALRKDREAQEAQQGQRCPWDEWKSGRDLA